VLLITISPCKAQQDSIARPGHQMTVISDTISKAAVQKILAIKKDFKNDLSEQYSSTVNAVPGLIADTRKKLSLTNKDSLAKSFNSIFNFKSIAPNRSGIKINRGFISYNTNYRSNIDTPFIEKNILQHNVYGNMNVSVANIPLKVNYLVRRSNSTFFRDINDIQVEFDAMQYAAGIRANLKEQLLSMVPLLNDSLLELDYKVNLDKFKNIGNWLNQAGLAQKLVECREILNVPGITIDGKLSDSANLQRSITLKKEATIFIETYEKTKAEWGKVKKKVDSLEHKYINMRNKVQEYRSLVNQQLNGNVPVDKLLEKIKDFGINSFTIPKKYQWLLNVRKLGVGRNQLNYSELTSKNMSLTGVNFEYNSWYYFAVAAGTVDYRFRDFVINRNNRSAQYMYMMRLGLGRVESTHLIVSLYKGQKQLFAVTNNTASSSSITLSGIAVEGRYSLNRNTYVSAEIASSLSPDFRNTPATQTKFTLDDHSDKAIAAKFYSYLPKTGSRFEAMYKYTGANFQSFSSFQTNSSLKSWYIKSDQLLFKRKLKIAAAIRSNEFSNPYIVQQYKSNTVFKSIQLTFRARKLPVVTAGFVPTSQITSVGSQFVENQFYSFNGGITHNYRIGERKANSVFIYNRFFNNEIDTSYLYYNATNIFFNQSIEFSLYTMNFSVSRSTSTSFELNVLDGGIRFQLLKSLNIGCGVKVSDFDRKISATGGYGSLQLNIKKLGVINMNYDNGFVPGNNHRFVRNEIMNLNYTRVF
jgi:hypothetical protein